MTRNRVMHGFFIANNLLQNLGLYDTILTVRYKVVHSK